MKEPYFAVGTALCPIPSLEAGVVVDAVTWLLSQRNSDAIWGSEDQLDLFISTNHVAMTLLSVGFSPNGTVLTPALEFLTTLDGDAQISFFWRSATLLNLPEHRSIVEADAKFIWQHRRRIGVHKDYPVPFFLLKLLRFAEPPLQLPFDANDVLLWILEDWREDECWYGRTSITSMAVSLLHDAVVSGKDRIVARSLEFLSERFVAEEDGTGKFSDNVVDDCFTVFNLCERDLLSVKGFDSLAACVEQAVRGIVTKRTAHGFWSSAPPFGGAIGHAVYPTAVAVRALMSFYVRRDGLFRSRVAGLMLDAAAELPRESPLAGQSFWGTVEPGTEEDLCFVLMPFERKLTEIYERYVKTVVAGQCGLVCERADDLNKPNVVMKDVWERINRARVIVADLTRHNANVFYELGLAHAIGKQVVLIAQRERGKRALLPFDVSGVRTIVYDDTPSGYEKLSETLVRFVKDAVTTSSLPQVQLHRSE